MEMNKSSRGNVTPFNNKTPSGDTFPPPPPDSEINIFFLHFKHISAFEQWFVIALGPLINKILYHKQISLGC